MAKKATKCAATPEAATSTVGAAVVAEVLVAENDLTPLAAEPFAGIVDDLINVLSQCRLAFLIGAGCSRCAGLPQMDELTAIVVESVKEPTKHLLKALIANFPDSRRCTIEDYMSELVDFIAIAHRREQRCSKPQSLSFGGNKYASEQLCEALDDIKQQIAIAIYSESKPAAVATHRDFVRAIHGTLRSGKTSAQKTPIDYFTVNYDTLIEDSLALERIPVSDGFSGGATGWWDLARYSDSSISARVQKLHGSIDWCLCDEDILPRRIRRGIEVVARQDHVLIWPAATKYRETQRDPYAQLTSLFRAALRPVANTQVILCVLGYAYADEHINVEIDRALHEAGGALNIIAFTSDDEPQGQLQLWLKDPEVCDRVRVYANKGYFHGTVTHRSDLPLPWWKFEVITRIVGTQRI